MSSTHARLSKRLSYVLRHAPESIGLSLAPGGWVSVQTLIQGLNSTLSDGVEPVTLAVIEEIVSTDSKQRYQVEGELIRATQGHSVQVDMGYIPATPPVQLFHGTTCKAWESIRVTGLLPMSRQFVHLSGDIETAHTVGARRSGELVTVLVDAMKASEAGVVFYQADNGVWLTEFIPAQFLTILSE